MTCKLRQKRLAPWETELGKLAKAWNLSHVCCLCGRSEHSPTVRSWLETGRGVVCSSCVELNPEIFDSANAFEEPTGYAIGPVLRLAEKVGLEAAMKRVAADKKWVVENYHK